VDKELTKLISIHLQVIERGLAVIHMPIRNRIFSDDIWDVDINKKLENFWSKKRRENPNYQPKYWQYTTFAGFLPFEKLSEKQEEEYEALKEAGRNESSDKIENKIPENFFEKVLRLIKDKN